MRKIYVIVVAMVCLFNVGCLEKIAKEQAEKSSQDSSDQKQIIEKPKEKTPKTGPEKPENVTEIKKPKADNPEKPPEKNGKEPQKPDETIKKDAKVTAKDETKVVTKDEIKAMIGDQLKSINESLTKLAAAKPLDAGDIAKIVKTLQDQHDQERDRKTDKKIDDKLEEQSKNFDKKIEEIKKLLPPLKPEEKGPTKSPPPKVTGKSFADRMREQAEPPSNKTTYAPAPSSPVRTPVNISPYQPSYSQQNNYFVVMQDNASYWQQYYALNLAWQQYYAYQWYLAGQINYAAWYNWNLWLWQVYANQYNAYWFAHYHGHHASRLR